MTLAMTERSIVLQPAINKEGRRRRDLQPTETRRQSVEETVGGQEDDGKTRKQYKVI